MIAEMLAQKVADDVAALTCVRPLSASLADQYPFAVYETLDMRSMSYLNCVSKQREGTVRFVIAAITYAQLSTLTEAVKDALIGYKVTGDSYRIRKCDLAGEGDVQEAYDDDNKQAYYVKTVDIDVKALKL